MAEHSKAVFEHQMIKLDGNLFVGCHFKNCKMIFEASGPIHFQGCSFDSCEWVFDGAALSTFSFLQFMYRTPGLEAVANKFFETAKRGG